MQITEPIIKRPLCKDPEIVAQNVYEYMGRIGSFVQKRYFCDVWLDVHALDNALAEWQANIVQKIAFIPGKSVAVDPLTFFYHVYEAGTNFRKDLPTQLRVEVTWYRFTIWYDPNEHISYSLSVEPVAQETL